jgi:hypothetical protein
MMFIEGCGGRQPGLRIGGRTGGTGGGLPRDELAEDDVPRLSRLSSSKLDWLPTAPYLKGGKHKLVTEPPTGEGEDRAETFCAPARPKTLKKSRRCVS